MATVTVQVFTDRREALDALAEAEFREALIEMSCPADQIERQVETYMRARRAACHS